MTMFFRFERAFVNRPASCPQSIRNTAFRGHRVIGPDADEGSSTSADSLRAAGSWIRFGTFPSLTYLSRVYCTAYRHWVNSGTVRGIIPSSVWALDAVSGQSQQLLLHVELRPVRTLVSDADVRGLRNLWLSLWQGRFFDRNNVGLGSLSRSPGAGSGVAVGEHEHVHAFSLCGWTRKRRID